MNPQPQPQSPPRPPRPSGTRRALASVGRAVLKALRVFFIVLLVIIPVPIANLFTRIFNPKRGTHTEQVLKKE